ncbi:MAG: hypothetical protein COA96_03530 [SAR86 cluster bacterium]|uniref:DUF2214 domain-containing protein n=1 Tax=SAR86 cluster bacterium TaxID=2030880 RepID=A0A2A5B6R7_9GAMM|nr:MAG: hypothetical protein COA96_03530 [SAR86 cluster bacterium]
MFDTLENTRIAIWVGESLYGYPFLLSLHAVGLAIVVGIFSMRDMRLLGLFHGLQPAAFLPLSKLAWLGFIINATSGFLLFTSQAVTFVNSTPFLLKVACIVVGMVLAGIIQSRLRNELAVDFEKSDNAVISGTTKLIALASLLSWVSAIIAGRLIAYF